MPQATPRSIDEVRALLLAALTQALSEVQDDQDASASISLAAEAHKIVCGDGALAEVEGFYPAEDGEGYEYRSDVACTCPPSVRDRGGFVSSCRACACA